VEAADNVGWEEGNTARWIETVVLRRRHRPAQALARLQALNARVDACRRKITNPLLRAGIAVHLQHLPWVTAITALEVGDCCAMLYAMEIAKARILSELRPAQTIIDTTTGPAAFLADVQQSLRSQEGRRHLIAYLDHMSA